MQIFCFKRISNIIRQKESSVVFESVMKSRVVISSDVKLSRREMKLKDEILVTFCKC